MKPSEEFLDLDKSFWAFVRTLSEEKSIGYTERGKDAIRIPTLEEIVSALEGLGLDSTAVRVQGAATELGQKLLAYFAHRAASINGIKDRLMDGATVQKRLSMKLGHAANPHAISQ